MKTIISHRGNINGSIPEKENNPDYVNEALKMGFEVEIDIWCIENKLYSGHDKETYEIDLEWLNLNNLKLWIHCKNIESILFFKRNNLLFNYFYHDIDLMTLTSKQYIWAYPGKQPIRDSIAVLPEIYNDDISNCIGVCTDYPIKYEKVNNLINMKSGWFIGDFEPSLFKTNNFEISVKKYKKGEYERSHYHKIATEFTVITSGRVKMNGVEYKDGDIIKIYPNESTDFLVLEDTITTVVKIPSVKNDKYID